MEKVYILEEYGEFVGVYSSLDNARKAMEKCMKWFNSTIDDYEEDETEVEEGGVWSWLESDGDRAYTISEEIVDWDIR